MCGPVDYHALHTCILRIAVLSVAGVAAYAAHHVIRILETLRRKTARRNARATP